MSRALLAVCLMAVVVRAEPPNFLNAAEGVFVGGAPADESDWCLLADRGVQTVVGVDGLPPDAASARRHGMRVVHVPIGYGGIPAEAATQLAVVAAVADRPLYVYCHRGRQRGPAAAAIVCRASGQMDRDAAHRLLVRAGTDTKYAGLWRDVAAFLPNGTATTSPPLTEASPVLPLRLAMCQLDEAWDRVTSAEEHEPRHEALVLAVETMRESRRAAELLGDPLTAGFDRAVHQLQELAATKDPVDWPAAFAGVSASCLACHTDHRDRAD